MIENIDGIHILIVEDDTLTQTLVKDVLHIVGFSKITIVGSGEEAIEVVKKNEIDLIICDWRMPGMTGLDVVKYLRALPPCKNTFVNFIMLTGNAEEKNIVDARDEGVTEYLIKPFVVKDLCAKIVEVVENPREFVISENYTGPSRRRRSLAPPDGIERRVSNAKPARKAK